MTRKKSRKRPKDPNSPELQPAIPDKVPPRVRFVLILSLSCAAVYALINAAPASSIHLVTEHTAWTLGQVLRLAGMPVFSRGQVLSAGRFSVTIIPECTALYSVGLYLCFLLAYPASFRNKLLGVAFGVPLIWSANLFRLILVFLVGYYDRPHLDVVHVYAGQISTVCLVFVSCGGWLRCATGRKGVPAEASWSSVGFLARFAFASTLLFILWLHLNRYYVWLLDQAMVFGLALFGKSVIVPRNLQLYYYTFNIVVFTSLLLSTRSMPIYKKAQNIAIGVCFLFSLHVLYRTCNAMVTAYQLPGFTKVAVLISTVGQYLAPLALWLVLAHPYLSTAGTRTASSPPPGMRSD